MVYEILWENFEKHLYLEENYRQKYLLEHYERSNIMNRSIDLSAHTPQRIELLSPYEIPLLNTIILFSTYAHYSLFQRNRRGTILGIIIIPTVILAVLFILLQAFEYVDAPFIIADGSTYFLATCHYWYIIYCSNIRKNSFISFD